MRARLKAALTADNQWYHRQPSVRLKRSTRLCVIFYRRLQQFRLVSLLLLIALLQILSLRPGHIWGDDFAHYIMQAKHMASLDGYVAREYKPNPEVLNLGPQTVPPGLSVILTPVYALFGLNLTAMKITLVLVFVAGLYFLDGLFRDRLPDAWRMALILVVGLDPLLFRMRDEIETEKPFLVFMLASLWLMQRAYAAPSRKPRMMRIAVLLGLCVFAACSTRNVGFALIPIPVLLDVIQLRRITRFSLAATAAAVIPLIGVAFLLRTTSGYAHLFNFSPLWIAHSALVFTKTFELFWWGLAPRWPGYLGLVLVGLAAMWGLYLAVGKRLTPVELFIPFYLGIILPYFAPGYAFYLIPLFPFLVAYALIGFRDLALRSGQYFPSVAAGAVAAAILFAAAYTKADWGPIREGIGDPEFMAVCTFLDRQMKPADLAIFRKPRLLALVTAHSSTVYPMHLDRDPTPDEIWRYLLTVRARYVVVGHVPDPDFSTDKLLDVALAQHAKEVSRVYENGHFAVYRLACMSTPLARSR